MSQAVGLLCAGARGALWRAGVGFMRREQVELVRNVTLSSGGLGGSAWFLLPDLSSPFNVYDLKMFHGLLDVAGAAAGWQTF